MRLCSQTCNYMVVGLTETLNLSTRPDHLSTFWLKDVSVTSFIFQHIYVTNISWMPTVLSSEVHGQAAPPTSTFYTGLLFKAVFPSWIHFWFFSSFYDRMTYTHILQSVSQWHLCRNIWLPKEACFTIFTMICLTLISESPVGFSFAFF